jgi:orotate phosphoribosyltransferase
MNKLAAEIRAICDLSGTFVLRSGLTTHSYFDKYRFEAMPELLAAVAREMVPLFPRETEVLAGLELGGIPIVTMLSHYSGLPAAFVRKAAKQYGTRRLCEGTEVSGRHVLLIEDIVTTGGQLSLSAADLRRLGASITHALCVIDRGQGGAANLARDGIALLSLFDRTDFSS